MLMLSRTSELSGGELQRVLVANSIDVESEVYFYVVVVGGIDFEAKN